MIFAQIHAQFCSIPAARYEVIPEGGLHPYMLQNGLDERVGVEEAAAHLRKVLALLPLVPVGAEPGHRRQGELLAGILIYEPV